MLLSSRASFLLILLLLPCFFVDDSSAASSMTSSTSTTYESIRALDENGESIQLQHASQAASQQGTFIMAVKHVRNQTIHIISVSSQPSYQRQRPLELVHTIAPDTFLLCSGVQADARWLVETLRQMHKQIQLRYGSSGSGWAQRLASLYRAVFWGVPNGDDDTKNSKWQQTRWLELKRWGRPLGVQSILIERNQLYALEPSGVIIVPDSDDDEDVYQLVAIGKHSRDILRQWHQSSSSWNTQEEESSLAEQLKLACEGILSRGTVLSIVQVGAEDVAWQMQLS